MSPFGEALVAANRLKVALNELAAARERGAARIGIAGLLMLEEAIEECSLHEALAGLHSRDGRKR